MRKSSAPSRTNRLRMAKDMVQYLDDLGEVWRAAGHRIAVVGLPVLQMVGKNGRNYHD